MFEKIALVGIGLIGSSIARAARLKGLLERQQFEVVIQARALV